MLAWPPTQPTYALALALATHAHPLALAYACTLAHTLALAAEWMGPRFYADYWGQVFEEVGSIYDEQCHLLAGDRGSSTTRVVLVVLLG